jgi:hypothetical protein
MKKFFTLIATALVALTASAEKITFGDAAVAAGSLAASYSDGSFVLSRVDNDNKHAIDLNNAYFGDASAQEKFGSRLKVGGKSSAKNSLTIAVPSAGTLKVYVRTGSNSATDRTLTLSQGGSTLYNKVVQESDAITVEMESAKSETNPTGETKVYPIISVPVTAGSVSVAYTVNSLNFYCFEFVAGEGGGSTPEPTPTPVAADAGKILFGDAAVAAGSLAASYSDGSFVLSRVDNDNKHAIDLNNAYFGDASAQEKFTSRLKVGGKSSAKNSLSLSIAGTGTLKVYVRTGSNSATDRNLVLSQGGSTLYNKVVQESDAITVEMESAKSETNPTGETKVYPIISVPVTAGTVSIEYPVNSLNFYCFEFVPQGTAVEAVAEAKAEAAPKVVKVIKNGKLYIGNYNVAGQQVK